MLGYGGTSGCGNPVGADIGARTLEYEVAERSTVVGSEKGVMAGWKIKEPGEGGISVWNAAAIGAAERLVSGDRS